jgi:hypothetical protein
MLCIFGWDMKLYSHLFTHYSAALLGAWLVTRGQSATHKFVQHPRVKIDKKKTKRGANSLATRLAANPSVSRAETISPPTSGLARARGVTGWIVQGRAISCASLGWLLQPSSPPSLQSQMIWFGYNWGDMNYEEMRACRLLARRE